ncbi:MAG TPA: Uma2 family endonuclease [Isosphaeraceae bacterium]|jgi:Uma2 family endonuclease|nr:Uma2 family endonuclease [Isosphaeraceae bacterium]
MRMLILDPTEQKRLIRRRRAIGADRFDEVWDGVYVIAPTADNEHQYVAGKLVSALDQAISRTSSARVYPGVNVSDRADDWKKNYRCPDVAVFLPGNPARDSGTHWLGWPDFAIEIVSSHDRSRRKLPFYAKVGVRELLLVNRRPWSLDLYRLREQALELAGRSSLETPQTLASDVLPLTFRLVAAEDRPQIEVSLVGGPEKWMT